ncbi:hypothetical protein AAVH_43754, partial [Aphelenchoides avenae]
MKKVQSTLDQVDAFIERADEDVRPELMEFMSEFFEENHVKNFELASTRLTNGMRKDLKEAEKRLAMLRRRECSVLSISRTQHSGLNPDPPRQNAAPAANDSPNAHGFAHSTPLPESEGNVNTLPSGGGDRNQACQPLFDSSVIITEEHA